MNNLYLTGMMGAGKSATGKRLAELLHCPFTDLDAVLEKKEKRAIAEIFEKDGEDRFRDLEEKILADFCGRSETVFATGGGIVLRPGNIRKMKETGKVIYLRTGVETLWQRVSAKTHRPLLKTQDPKQAVRDLFEKRKPLYESSADYTVDTDGKTPSQVAQEISAWIQHHE